jgi:hypothetical protein
MDRTQLRGRSGWPWIFARSSAVAWWFREGKTLTPDPVPELDAIKGHDELPPTTGRYIGGMEVVAVQIDKDSIL